MKYRARLRRQYHRACREAGIPVTAAGFTRYRAMRDRLDPPSRLQIVFDTQPLQVALADLQQSLADLQQSLADMSATMASAVAQACEAVAKDLLADATHRGPLR